MADQVNSVLDPGLQKNVIVFQWQGKPDGKPKEKVDSSTWYYKRYDGNVQPPNTEIIDIKAKVQNSKPDEPEDFSFYVAANCFEQCDYDSKRTNYRATYYTGLACANEVSLVESVFPIKIYPKNN